jgi:hypothetical protein
MYYLLREGGLGSGGICSRLTPTTSHWALMVGYGFFSLCIPIYRESVSRVL